MAKISEAFIKGTAAQVAKKLFNILSRSYKTYTMSPVPLAFQRDGDTYSGFYGFTDSGEAVRIDFRVSGRADEISNIDIWTKPGDIDQPDMSFVCDGMNIMEIYKELIKFLGDEAVSAVHEEIVRESLKTFYEARGQFEQDFAQFMAEMKIDPSTTSSSKAYPMYVKWAEKKHKNAMGNGSFYVYFKKNASESPAVGDLDSNDSDVRLRRGSTESNPVSLDADADEFEKEVLKNEVVHKYNMFETVVEEILKGNPMYKNIFIGGNPGIGKSYSVKQALKKVGGIANGKTRVNIIQGSISGFTGLLQVLWENRMPDQVIILDDTDNLIQANAPQAVQNVWKVAMDTNEPRIISWKTRKFNKPTSAAEARAELEMPGIDDETGDEDFEESIKFNPIYGYTKPLYQAAVYKKPLKEGYGVIMNAETDPSYGLGPGDPITDAFQFAGRVIFLSNLPYIPGPLADRCIVVMLNLSKEQVLQLIESRIAGVMRDNEGVTMQMKKEALDFLKKYQKVTNRITFRQFEAIVMLIASGAKDWQQWAYIQMKSSTLGK